MEGEMKTPNQLILFIIISYGLAATVDIFYYIMGFGFSTSPDGDILIFVPTWGLLRMYTPLAASILVMKMYGYDIMKWIRSNLRIDLRGLFFYILTPSIVLLTVGIYYVVYRGLTGAGLANIELPEPLGELPQHIKLLLLIVNGYTASITINALYAYGEEMGWRAFLLEKLKTRYGKGLSILLTGLIWGFWHYPAMLLLGYGEIDIFGDPPYITIFKMGIYPIFTVFIGALLAYSYWMSRNILVPSGIHGAVNAYWGLTRLTTIRDLYIEGITDITSWMAISIISYVLYGKWMEKN